MTDTAPPLRYGLASAAAAIPFLLLAGLNSLWVMIFYPGHTPDGEPDDGPVRGAVMFFLVGWPFIYALLALGLYFGAQILTIMGILSRTLVMRAGIGGIALLALASALTVPHLTLSARALEFLSTCVPTVAAFAWATSLWFRVASRNHPRRRCCAGTGVEQAEPGDRGEPPP